MDNKEFLQPDFDPKTLKVPQLRSLFVEYGIHYPSSAKKPELIEIFKNELAPRAESILKELRDVTADGSGIINVPKVEADVSAIEAGEKSQANTPNVAKEEKPKKKKSKTTLTEETPKKKKVKAEASDEGSPLTEKKEPKKKLKKIKVSHESESEADTTADTSLDTHFSNRNVFQRASLSPQSKKTPVKSKLESSLKKEDESDISKDSVFVTPKTEPVIPKKRAHQNGDEASTKKSDSKVSKKSKVDQEKFEEGPDIFKPAKVTPSKTPKKTPKKTPVKSSAKKVSSKVEDSFQSAASFVDESFKSTTGADISKLEGIASSSVAGLKEFIAVSPDFAKQLGKKIIPSPLSVKKEASSTPKGPKKNLKFVHELNDKKVEMKIITPSIADEEEELKRLQDEMSIHLDATKQKVDKVQDDIEVEEASEAVESAVSNLFFRFIYGIGLALLFVTSFVITVWYFDQKQKIGFCGNEVFERTFKVENYEEFDLEGLLTKQFGPTCAPCPAHGSCGPFLKLSCDEDFLVSHPWYSFGGILPIPGTCVPDKIKQQRVEEMVSYSLEVLRARNAENCGQDSDADAGLTKNEIHDLLKGSQDNLLGDDKFEELWGKVLEDLRNEPEITLRFPEGDNRQDQDSNSDEKDEIQDQIFRSVSKAKFSIKCRFQELIYKQLARFKYVIIGVIVVVVATFAARWNYKRYIANKEKVDKLTSLIIKKLNQQNKIAAKDKTGLTRDYLALVQLRDVLIDNASKNKSKLWGDIVKNVSRNSNIEERTIEVGGEIIKIWKWIGVDIDELAA